MRILLRASLNCAWILQCAALIAGWLQEFHPVFDSFSHFRLHFIAALIILTFIFAVRRRQTPFFSSVAILAVSFYLTAPYLPTPNGPVAATPPNGEIVRVVQMNLRFNNRETQLAIAELKKARADIMLLQEVTRTTENVLFGFSRTHPHQLSCQITGVGSVAIVSKFQFVSDDTNHCARFFGYARAQVQIGKHQVTLASFHSLWPWPRGQQGQVEKLMPEFETLGHPLIIAGDFNSAPWSAVVQRVALATRTTVAEGLKFTWAPRFLGFKKTFGALLPIDQLLTSNHVIVRSRTVLGDGGSDHFPVVSELILTN